MSIEILALLVAIIAVVISLISLNEVKKNNRLNNSPFLNAHEVSESGCYEYFIDNKGNGIAQVKAVQYYWDFKEVEFDNFKDNISKSLYSNGVRGQAITTTRMGEEIIIAAGERLLIGKITYLPEFDESFESAMKGDYGFTILYESQYGEEKMFYSNNDLKDFLVNKNNQKVNDI